jgi:hypothetical protein
MRCTTFQFHDILDEEVTEVREIQPHIYAIYTASSATAIQPAHALWIRGVNRLAPPEPATAP